MNKQILFFALLAVLATCKSIYDDKVSYVTPINNLNFKFNVLKIRETTNFVTIVQYYKYNDGFSQNFAKDFDAWTNDYRGLFKIGAVDCDESAAICEKEKITKFPTFRIYPPTPMPSIDMEGEITTKALQQKAAKQLHSNVIEITSANIQTFVADSPSVPKVFLFTDSKKGTPMIYKGLSVSFEKKLFFGLIRSSDEILVDRYRIKKFPTIIVVKTNEKKHEAYSGEVKFTPIHDWLNVFSQTFVPGGGSTADSAASKAWLTEVVPELHQKSANDICLKTEGTLCVIHIGKGKPEKTVVDVLKDLNTQYDRKIERGSQFKFMWLDAEIEKEYSEAFEFKGESKVVILNPGKRKRFVVHEDALTFASLKKTFEKINGGDARFVRVDLPKQFAFRKE